jgi:hypothetical protein
VINAGSGNRMGRLRQTILLLFFDEKNKTYSICMPFLEKSLNGRGGARLRIL